MRVSTDVVGVLKNEDEVQFEEKMKTAWAMDTEVRFEVTLPWKVNPETLESNLSQATKRDLSLRRQFKKNIDVYNLFQEQINDMINNGILRKVSAMAFSTTGLVNTHVIFVFRHGKHLMY